MTNLALHSQAMDSPVITRRSLTIAAIVPAHNEGGRIGHVLSVLHEVGDLEEIVVVDDGSSDDTFTEVQHAANHDRRVHCLRLPVNQGKGAALFAGARSVQADLLLLLDADLEGLQSQHVYALIEPIHADRADMTLGLFRGGRFNTDLAHWMAPFLTGQRCLWSKLFFQIPERSSSGYGFETAAGLTAWRNSWRCEHVPLRGVTHPPSEFHRGLWHGLQVRTKMYSEIMFAWYRECDWDYLPLWSRSSVCKLLRQSRRWD